MNSPQCHSAIHQSAERLYEQLDEMQRLRRLARHDLLLESRKHSISDKLRQIPYVGPIRVALLIALLQKDHNHDLKGLFKATATMASMRPGPFGEFYLGLLAKGMKPAMARLTLARKIAAITLTLWRKGESFDAEKLKQQAA